MGILDQHKKKRGEQRGEQSREERRRVNTNVYVAVTNCVDFTQV